MATARETDPIPDEIHQEALADALTRILRAEAWAVACTYVSDARACIAAVNVYTDLGEAVAAYQTLRSEVGGHESAVFIPVGPVLESEVPHMEDHVGAQVR